MCLCLLSEAHSASKELLTDPVLNGVAKLIPSDATERDGFGRSIALSADGRTALFGAEKAVCSRGMDCGAAYVFVRETGGTWIQQQKLTSSDAHAFSNFGHAVALSGDGDTALIGADTGTGSGYIFVRRRNHWSQRQELTVHDAGSSANFGWSVALSADGKTALIGAINAVCPTGADGCGAAYVFTRGTNDSWVEQQKLTASDASPDDEFGSSVALSADGKIALLGVFFADCSTGNDCGAAYVFSRASSGAWLEQKKLTASDQAASAEFGSSIALSSNGKTALIGAPNAFCPSGMTFCGAAYVFAVKDNTWVEQQKLTVASDAGGAFGAVLGLAPNGQLALIGDRDAECPALGGECGAAYIFAYNRGHWLQQKKLTASDATLADSFGVSVALSAGGKEALVGTDNALCPSSPNCGSADVFRMG